MELFIVIYRTIFFYIFILIIYRLMGKREVGKLSVQDLVVNLLIAEMVAISIENISDSLWLTVIPIMLLFLLEVVNSFLSLKYSKFRDIMEGKPSLIINKGKISFNEMVKQRYTLDDLLLELRNNNIKNIEDVEYAILENNGKLSIFKYNFLKINGENPFPLILDGKVQNDTLRYLNKTETWLFKQLDTYNVSLEEVFYCFYRKNKLYLIKKSDLI